jgi:hypothetical protein
MLDKYESSLLTYPQRKKRKEESREHVVQVYIGVRAYLLHLARCGWIESLGKQLHPQCKHHRQTQASIPYSEGLALCIAAASRDYHIVAVMLKDVCGDFERHSLVHDQQQQRDYLAQ